MPHTKRIARGMKFFAIDAPRIAVDGRIAIVGLSYSVVHAHTGSIKGRARSFAAAD